MNRSLKLSGTSFHCYYSYVSIWTWKCFTNNC